MPNAKRLPGLELQRLSRTSAVRGLIDVVTPWAIILLSIWSAEKLDRWYATGFCVIVIASRQAALANLAHDAWHRLCFPSRRANDLVGAWLYSYPVGIPFFHDRKRHLTHHRLVGLPDDPDWVNYSNDGRETSTRVLLFFAGRLTGSLLWSTAWSILVTRKPRIALAEDTMKSGEPRHEMLRVVLCQVLLFALFGLGFGWWSYLVYWLLPIATLTAFCNSVRAFVEHACAARAATPEERLRDIDASLPERLFLSPAHFHFHALHHQHPSIPHYRLAYAKRVLIAEAGSYPYPMLPGYIRALRLHLSALANESTSSP